MKKQHKSHDKIRILKVGKKQIKVVLIPKLAPQQIGECDYETKSIKILNSIGMAERRWTCFHEVIHAALPELSEKQVEKLERYMKNYYDQLTDLWP